MIFVIIEYYVSDSFVNGNCKKQCTITSMFAAMNKTKAKHEFKFNGKETEVEPDIVNEQEVVKKDESNVSKKLKLEENDSNTARYITLHLFLKLFALFLHVGQEKFIYQRSDNVRILFPLRSEILN